MAFQKKSLQMNYNYFNNSDYHQHQLHLYTKR